MAAFRTTEDHKTSQTAAYYGFCRGIRGATLDSEVVGRGAISNPEPRAINVEAVEVSEGADCK